LTNSEEFDELEMLLDKAIEDRDYFEKERDTLKKQVEDYEKLVVLLNDYNDLLGEELNSCAPVAHIHGWRSDNASKGEELRERIEKQIKALKE
jgi:hypothetical protein